MSGRDLLIEDVPDDLFQWLQAEAVRCGQTVSELVIDILETHRFWNATHDDKNEDSEAEARRKAGREAVRRC